MGAILASLATIAATLLLDKVGNKIDDWRAKKVGVSPDDILKIVKEMTAEATAKGSNVLAKLQDKLNGITFPFGMSPSVKQYLITAQQKVKDKYNKANEAMNDALTKFQTVEQRASNLAGQTSDYRSSDFGREEFNDIKTKTGEAVQDFNKIIKGVENSA